MNLVEAPAALGLTLAVDKGYKVFIICFARRRKTHRILHVLKSAISLQSESESCYCFCLDAGVSCSQIFMVPVTTMYLYVHGDSRYYC